MKRILVASLLMATALLPARAQTIGGTYTVKGTNFDGSSYGGEAEITLTSKTTCVIVWKTGNTTSQGICMRNDNAFAASYVLGKDVGLVVYQVMDDGELDGTWTIAGQDGSGTEVLTPK